MKAMAVDVLMPVISSAGEEAVVTAWFVDDGQACAAGQLIAEVQAAEALVESTRADFESSRQHYERQEELYDIGSLSSLRNIPSNPCCFSNMRLLAGTYNG